MTATAIVASRLCALRTTLPLPVVIPFGPSSPQTLIHVTKHVPLRWQKIGIVPLNQGVEKLLLSNLSGRKWKPMSISRNQIFNDPTPESEFKSKGYKNDETSGYFNRLIESDQLRTKRSPAKS